MRRSLIRLERRRGQLVYTTPNWPDNVNLLCLTCNELKNWRQFPLQDTSSKTLSYRAHCTKCLKKRGNGFDSHPLYSIRLHDFLSQLLRSSKAGAPGRGLLHCLELSDLFDKYYAQSGMCAVSGVPMTMAAVGSRTQRSNISIDRIDSDYGYSPSNTHLVCWAVNLMKLDMSMDELRFWCAHITLKHASDDEGLTDDEDNSTNQAA